LSEVVGEGVKASGNEGRMPDERPGRQSGKSEPDKQRQQPKGRKRLKEGVEWVDKEEDPSDHRGAV
jgi:hypothetical protein